MQANLYKFSGQSPEVIPFSPGDQEISQDLYIEQLAKLNESWRIIEDPDTGKPFEIGVIGEEHADQGVTCEIATYTSSLSGNSGNAVEMGEHASLPHQLGSARLYVASFGNGGSAYFDNQERKHIRKTGRFTHGGEYPVALPTIKALARALQHADLDVTRFTTNSAGGAHATALMTELPQDQVTHAYIKGRPNISKLRFTRDMIVGMLVTENLINGARNDKASDEDWKMTGELQKQAEELLPRIYQDSDPRVPALGKLATLRKLLTDAKAYSRGGYPDAPAYWDTEAAILHQQRLNLTYHFTDQDHLYRTPDDYIDFCQRISRTATIDFGLEGLVSVEAIVSEGTHADHTFFPSRRWVAEAYALTR